MAKIGKDELAALRAQHGEDCKVLRLPQFPKEDFVFRRCTPAEFDAMAVAMNSRDPATSASAPRQLAADLLVWPSEDKWRDFAEQYPGYAHTLGQKLGELAGVGVEVMVGKD